MQNAIEQLTQELTPLMTQIVNCPLYAEITTISHVRLFMQQHVFAVWDFMCLLKELHRRLVSTTAPWFPPKDALSAHLIGSILTEEESDLAESGVDYISHYDLYLKAMHNIGADIKPIQRLLALLHAGHSIESALGLIKPRPATQQFVLTTFSFFECSDHELAAAFVYGREGITAAMFAPFLQRLESDSKHQKQLTTLIYYFKRHIELDDQAHFPKALNMLANLIGDDATKYQEAKKAAMKALTARIHFLHDMQALLQEQKTVA